MSDPAIEAAQRAQGAPMGTGIAAAREALKPIRELHKRQVMPSSPHLCAHDAAFWPCDTALLIYTSEELAS